MEYRWDVVIAGGGIVGLATAHRLLQRRPGLRVLVLEREYLPATQQSDHNSGVVHAGVYYAPGSLKAELCRRGRALLLDFCRRHDIPYRITGKLIVARDSDERPRLHELKRRAEANGVSDARLMTPAEMREVEPHVFGVEALHVPSTAVVDFREVARVLSRRVNDLGGLVRVSTTVKRVERRPDGLVVHTSRGHEWTGGFIACAGLYSDRLAAAAGAPADLTIIPFRGDYYEVRPERRELCRGLIYPVPDPRFPFLGVHFTRDIHDRVLAGPNAVLAFSRQGYGRFDVRPADLAETLRWPGFWRLASRHLPTGLAEMWRDYNRASYVTALQDYLPALRSIDVTAGPSGVRAQALTRDGRLLDDFSFHVAERMLHVRNAPSPAATSSLAIAEAVVEKARDALGLALRD